MKMFNPWLHQLKKLAGSVLLLCALTAIGYGMNAFGFFNQFDVRWLDQHVTLRSTTGISYFLLLFAALSAVAMPRQLIAFVGGYGYGVLSGTLLATLATTLGAMLSFHVARRLLASTRAGDWLRNQPAINGFMLQQTFSKTVAIRFFPVGNNLLTNLLAGCSATPATPFLAGSFVGYLPQMLVFALAGSGVSINSQTRIVLGILLLGASSLIGIYLCRTPARPANPSSTSLVSGPDGLIAP